MKIVVNGVGLNIDDNIYNTADKISDIMLKSIQAQSESQNKIILYYSILIALHKKTGEILTFSDTDGMDILLKAWGVENVDEITPENFE